MSKKSETAPDEIVVGVDDGFAMTKVVVMQGGKIIKRLMLPSRARSGIQGTTIIGGPDDESGIEARYETDGVTFTVANLPDSESARFDEYPFSGMNRAIITHALRVARLGGKKVRIATGLPLSTYYKGDEPDQAVIDRKISSVAIPVRPMDDSPVANVESHQVFPEGLAAWIDFFVDHNGKITGNLEESIGIIDIGGRTTDIAVVLPGRQIDHARCGSADLGVLNVIEEVAIALKKEHKVTLGADKIEPALRTGTVKLWGKDVDIKPLIDQAVTGVLSAVMREVNRRLGSAVDLDRILLVGGGAYVFAKVAQQYPNITIPEEPEYANARGFAKYLTI